MNVLDIREYYYNTYFLNFVFISDITHILFLELTHSVQNKFWGHFRTNCIYKYLIKIYTCLLKT